MASDAMTSALNAAIEEAHGLNERAHAVLEKALKKATGDLEAVDSYQYRCAVQMLKVYIREQNLSARYFLTRMKKQKAGRKREMLEAR